MYKVISGMPHNVLGIDPVNEFTCISRSVSRVAPNPLPTHVAMLPTRELYPRRNDFKDEILPNELGIVPVKKFLFKYKVDMLTRLPKDEGRDPRRLVNGSRSEFNDVN